MNVHSSGFSGQFVAGLKPRVGLPVLLLRLVLVLPFVPLRLLGALLEWLGDLGGTLVSWHERWTSEVQTLTCTGVFTELKRLRDRAVRAEERLRLLGATVDEEPL